MDFIDGLPRTKRGYNSTLVIVDGLTKSARFILIKSSRTTSKLTDVCEIGGVIPWCAEEHFK